MTILCNFEMMLVFGTSIEQHTPFDLDKGWDRLGTMHAFLEMADLFHAFL